MFSEMTGDSKQNNGNQINGNHQGDKGLSYEQSISQGNHNNENYYQYKTAGILDIKNQQLNNSNRQANQQQTKKYQYPMGLEFDNPLQKQDDQNSLKEIDFSKKSFQIPLHSQEQNMISEKDICKSGKFDNSINNEGDYLKLDDKYLVNSEIQSEKRIQQATESNNQNNDTNNKGVDGESEIGELRSTINLDAKDDPLMEQINNIDPKVKVWKVDIPTIFPDLKDGIGIDDIEDWINKLRSQEKALQLGCVWVVKCGKSYGRYPRKLELICTKNGCTAYFNLRVMDSNGQKYFLEDDNATHNAHVKFNAKEISNRVSRIKALKDRKPKQKSSKSQIQKNMDTQQTIEKQLDITKQNTQIGDLDTNNNGSNVNENFTGRPYSDDEGKIQQEKTENSNMVEEVQVKKVLRKRGRKPLNHGIVYQNQFPHKIQYEYPGGGEQGMRMQIKYLSSENELLKKCIKQGEDLMDFSKQENERARNLIVQLNVKIQQQQREIAYYKSHCKDIKRKICSSEDSFLNSEDEDGEEYEQSNEQIDNQSNNNKETSQIQSSEIVKKRHIQLSEEQVEYEEESEFEDDGEIEDEEEDLNGSTIPPQGQFQFQEDDEEDVNNFQ